MLVANRGEIAVRIIKACRELGIETVIAFSDADRESMAVRMADQSICIGPAQAHLSYLNVNAVVTAAIGTNCDAIHPGYGFLCEQPTLPETCARYGILFIGPSVENIRQMGDKILARKLAKEVIPVTPGVDLVQNIDEAIVAAKQLGYPVLLKAASGGGGRGMVLVYNTRELPNAFGIASGEAFAAFGDSSLYMEHYVQNTRHIEVQIAGDHYENVMHFGERDCSIQRRYQKILEESPSTAISPEIRKEITAAAVALGCHIHYQNVGTVEFLFDMDQEKFYFTEMNTRIQVEHPVTEMVTGFDLVQEQIRLAAGVPLSVSEVRQKGHSIECRINAECPEDSFRPCPGTITQWSPPQGDGIRIDSHCYEGYIVPPYYDSLLAKVIVLGNTRLEAIKRMEYALSNFLVSGVSTTIPFHARLLRHSDFVNNRTNTCWIQQVFSKGEA